MGHDMNALHTSKDTQEAALLETDLRNVVAFTVVDMVWQLSCIVLYISKTARLPYFRHI
jgi:hypothetical protein